MPRAAAIHPETAGQQPPLPDAPGPETPVAPGSQTAPSAKTRSTAGTAADALQVAQRKAHDLVVTHPLATLGISTAAGVALGLLLKRLR